MFLVADDLDSPSRWISIDADWCPVSEPILQGTKLFRFSRIYLCFAPFNPRSKGAKHQYAYSLHHISGPEVFDFPLLIVRYANRRRQIETYKALSPLQLIDGTTTDLFRVLVDIEGVRKGVPTKQGKFAYVAAGGASAPP